MINRILSCWLCILLLANSVFVTQASARVSVPTTVAHIRPVVSPYAWIARFFVRELRSWMIGRVFDQVARLALARNGRQSAHNLTVILREVPLTNSERTQLNAVRNEIQQIVVMLERNNRSDEQVRQDLRNYQNSVRRSLDQLERELAYFDQRITQVELQQRNQHKMIVDLDGQVIALRGQVVDHEGRLVNLDQRVREIDSRTTALEQTVYPDPNRFLRHEWVFSLAALYANSPVLGNDATIGGQLAAQYNLNKTFGVFADLFWAPISASDAEGFDTGSRVYWESYGGMLGLTANLLPPQSFVSFQLAGGGGIVHSALSEYPEGVSISDPEGGFELGSVSNVALIGKAELGISPPATWVEPFAAFGYMRFIDEMAFENDETTTNAGNELWYLTFGLRLRVFDRGGRR